MKKFFLKNDHVLVGLVFILWTIGRVVLPVLREGPPLAGGVPNLLGLTLMIYFLMHGAVLFFGAWLLLTATLPRLVGQTKAQRAEWWQVALYIYVVATVSVSLFYLTYELGS